MFWEIASNLQRNSKIVDGAALKTVFGSRLGYSYFGFRQAVLLYEESFPDAMFDFLCEEVASAVALRPDFTSLLRMVGEHQHVGAVVVTCGLRLVWEKILEKAGLSETVKVIGGGRIADGLVVTPAVKAALVLNLQKTHKMYVWAFGDSPLDLPMLAQADEAVVVVGEETSRSRSMDASLLKAIDSEGLQARQILVPGEVAPRLDADRLPLATLSGPGSVCSEIFGSLKYASPRLCLVDATDRQSARVLMSPMRDANIAGPKLREAHHNVGWYLAIELLTELVGVEEYPMKHVQGNTISGYRLRHEQKTLIVPLMRGGEAMAFGVNHAFLLARFVHASRPDDIQHCHLQAIRNVILVDSVINSGGTIVEFARRIRDLRPQVRVIVVAGVVQSRSVSEGGHVHEYSIRHGLELVALRISDNKYTGRRGTDTGNRLFNTTHIQ
ncbi:uracil phosphoribosyltransferase-domain-containing protein [Hypoxylon sp. NC1633]|nr:uracil phosphoribosyltransferase-domain-containing protein [Hypoxylon sp. NC1633]